MIFYLLMWSPLAACIFIVRYYSNDPTVVEPGTLASTALGIALLGGLYMSMGCFASSLTRNQIIAAMFSFALGISLFMLSFLSAAMTGRASWVGKILAHVSLVEHMRDFAHGVIDIRPLVFYLSLTTLFLFLTLKAVESRRWK
jgi:ABC-2 type transport system permease protein